MPMLSKKKVEELRKTRLFRIIDTKEGHHGYMYKVGLNEDPVEFSVRGGCVRGGLYFCKASELDSFWNYGDRVAEVEIPDGEPVFHVVGKGVHKYRSRKIIISSLYKKEDIIDTLIRLGMDKKSAAFNRDCINGVLDLKYSILHCSDASSVLSSKISKEAKIKFLQEVCFTSEYSTGALQNCSKNKEQAELIIEAGGKLDGGVVIRDVIDYFYVNKKWCLHLLDNCSSVNHFVVQDIIRKGHVGLLREIIKRGLITSFPAGPIDFYYYVSKDRRSEIRKLCAK